MVTITDILQDVDSGILANNMVENYFLYRIVFFVNEGNKGSKRYIDAQYADLRKTFESIIRNYLSLTNNIVIAQTTAEKNGKCVCLQSRSYSFNLDEYFKRISGECKDSNRSKEIIYNRYAIR